MDKSKLPLLNLEKMMFLGTGEYRIPVIQPLTEYDPTTRWIPYHYINECKLDPSKLGMYFYIDDYRFDALWNTPDKYVNRLKRYRYVLSPDFSIYANMPKALQVYNHYRKHWLAAYWQYHGIKVIPTITWTLPQNLQFCLDGEPTHGIISTSFKGLLRNKDIMDTYWDDYDYVMDRLQPKMVLFHGIVPDRLKGKVVPMKDAYTPFSAKMAKIREEEKKNK